MQDSIVWRFTLMENNAAIEEFDERSSRQGLSDISFHFSISSTWNNQRVCFFFFLILKRWNGLFESCTTIFPSFNMDHMRVLNNVFSYPRHRWSRTARFNDSYECQTMHMFETPSSLIELLKLLCCAEKSCNWPNHELRSPNVVSAWNCWWYPTWRAKKNDEKWFDRSIKISCKIIHLQIVHSNSIVFDYCWFQYQHQEQRFLPSSIINLIEEVLFHPDPMFPQGWLKVQVQGLRVFVSPTTLCRCLMRTPSVHWRCELGYRWRRRSVLSQRHSSSCASFPAAPSW